MGSALRPQTQARDSGGQVYECSCGRSLVGSGDRGLAAQLSVHWRLRHGGELGEADLRRLLGSASLDLSRLDVLAGRPGTSFQGDPISGRSEQFALVVKP